DDTSLTEVSDIVLNPPATDKYAALENRLVNSFEDSAERKLHKLLNENRNNRSPRVSQSQVFNSLLTGQHTFSACQNHIFYNRSSTCVLVNSG
ncbi:hypothetical protein ALC62_07179, partial [Cyphomyrmex costatus]